MATWSDIANDSYGAATLLVQDRCWRSAISRAYYATYAYLTGALTSHRVTMRQDREGPSHAQLPELVVSKLTKLDVRTRWRLCTRIRDLYLMRITADYSSSAVESGDAHAAMTLMTEVFGFVKGRYYA